MAERYAERVQRAVLPLAALGEQVGTSMRSGHGVEWWTGLDVGRNILVADYIIGLTESVAGNLTQASMHLNRLTTLGAAHDITTSGNMRAADARGGLSGPTSATYDNQGVELEGHFGGFFRAIGSVLDNLAGIVVGTAGIPLNIVRTGWGELTTAKPSRLAPASMTDAHQDLNRKVAARVDQLATAGTPDWIGWALDYRNMLVHRASRLSINVMDAKAKTGVAHPLPKHPDQTHAESLARSRDLPRDIVGRNTDETLGLILDEVTTLAAALGGLFVETWDERRSIPDLSGQPQEQWPTLRRGRERAFVPTGPPSNFKSATLLVMNPTMAARMRRAQLLDEDHRQWSQWLAADHAPPDRPPSAAGGLAALTAPVVRAGRWCTSAGSLNVARRETGVLTVILRWPFVAAPGRHDRAHVQPPPTSS